MFIFSGVPWLHGVPSFSLPFVASSRGPLCKLPSSSDFTKSFGFTGNHIKSIFTWAESAHDSTTKNRAVSTLLVGVATPDLHSCYACNNNIEANRQENRNMQQLPDCLGPGHRWGTVWAAVITGCVILAVCLFIPCYRFKNIGMPWVQCANAPQPAKWALHRPAPAPIATGEKVRGTGGWKAGR